jgi:pentatricopeptide repeat protein
MRSIPLQKQHVRACIVATLLHGSLAFLVRPQLLGASGQRHIYRPSTLRHVVAPQCGAQAGAAAMTQQRRSEIIKCAQVADWKNALAILTAMVAEGTPRDTACYAGVIRACSMSARADEALDTFSQMQEEGIPPTTAAYNAAIVGCIGELISSMVAAYTQPVRSPACSALVLLVR